jgi:hypothetical protein
MELGLAGSVKTPSFNWIFVHEAPWPWIQLNPHALLPSDFLFVQRIVFEIRYVPAGKYKILCCPIKSLIARWTERVSSAIPSPIALYGGALTFSTQGLFGNAMFVAGDIVAPIGGWPSADAVIVERIAMEQYVAIGCMMNLQEKFEYG